MGSNAVTKDVPAAASIGHMWDCVDTVLRGSLSYGGEGGGGFSTICYHLRVYKFMTWKQEAVWTVC